MKRILIYLCTIVLGASIPIYFLLIWEPLKSKEALSNNAISSSTDSINELNKNEELVSNGVEVESIFLKQRDTSNSLYNYLDTNRKEKLDSILKKLSVVDLVKISDSFSDKDNKDKIKDGIKLVKKRMSLSDYEIFKNILEDYVDLSILS